MQTDSIGTRQDWEISWHIFLQVAVAASKWEEATCRVMGMTRIEAINRAVDKANGLVVKHGAPGTAALSVAADSLAVLADGGCDGLAPIVVTTRTDLTAGGVT